MTSALDEREALAALMTRNGFATGHGDTFSDLLRELEAQLGERLTASEAEATSLRRKLEEHRKALEPFALVARQDIGEDEADADRFQPMRTPYNRAPLLTVGDLRRARTLTGASE